jgi:hypothetical protein
MSERIEIDLNRLTRGEFAEIMGNTPGVRLSLDDTATLVARVVTDWPFEPEISEDGFRALGLVDSREVEDVVTAALKDLAKKN